MKTSQLPTVRLVAALDHSGCTSVAHALVDLRVCADILGLDAGIQEILGSSARQVVFLYTPPEIAVAHALSNGLEPVGFLEQWINQHEILLGCLKLHHGRWVVIEALAAGQNLARAATVIGASPPQTGLENLITAPLALERTLAAAVVKGATHAHRIATNLAAISAPLDAVALEPPSIEDAVREYLNGHSESVRLVGARPCVDHNAEPLDAARKAGSATDLPTASDAPAGEVAELKAENELLFLQLHQVQEELESWFLRARGLESDLSNAKQSARISIDQASKNKEIAENLARERYNVIQELRRQKRDLENAHLHPKNHASLPEISYPTSESVRQTSTLQKPATMSGTSVLTTATEFREEVETGDTLGAASNLLSRLSGLFRTKRNIKGLNRRDIAVIRQSGLFDAFWYLQTNPDVAQARFDPVKHYLAFGFAERRNPSLGFDASFYLEQNPDVLTAGSNPLLHYLKYGKAEGRLIRPVKSIGN